MEIVQKRLFSGLLKDKSNPMKTLHPFSVLLFVLRFPSGYIRPCRYSFHPPRQGVEER